MRVAVLVVAVVLATLPAAASEPGQPLDCSDLGPLLPGYTCTKLPIGMAAGVRTFSAAAGSP